MQWAARVGVVPWADYLYRGATQQCNQTAMAKSLKVVKSAVAVDLGSRDALYKVGSLPPAVPLPPLPPLCHRCRNSH